MGFVAFAFGDALLYVILPVHADAFGVSMLMVGFLLAVNRIIRTFAYGYIADLAERVGLKNVSHCRVERNSINRWLWIS